MKGIKAIWNRDNRWWAGETPNLVITLDSRPIPISLDTQIARLARQYPQMEGFGALPYPQPGKEECKGFIYLYFQPPRQYSSLDELLGAFDALTGEPQTGPTTVVTPPRPVSNAQHYQACFDRIQEHLKDGDVYQINYTERFEGPALSDPLARWLRALKKRPAPHACYADLSLIPDSTIKTLMSLSPERLLKISNRRIVTEPIKGSAARGKTGEEDDALGRALLASEKNRAENLMIVDLLRNDLGKICTPGSVRTEKLFELKKFPSIQHLVSTISGELLPDVGIFPALNAVFPGGSITGAPKIKAMEIINQLELSPRNFYCGSAFSFDAKGNMDANILIRTFQQTDNMLYCHAGGGIVADSEMGSEYQEMNLKIEPLIDAMCNNQGVVTKA